MKFSGVAAKEPFIIYTRSPISLPCNLHRCSSRRQEIVATRLLLQGNTQFQQAAALGPNGLTLGPNKVNSPSSEQERQAQGNLGIQNLKIGKDGLIVNDGSRLNSSVLASLPRMAPDVARAVD